MQTGPFEWVQMLLGHKQVRPTTAQISTSHCPGRRVWGTPWGCWAWHGDAVQPQLETQALPSAPSLCLKSQLVDLKAHGYWEELLDLVRPDIVVKDW